MPGMLCDTIYVCIKCHVLLDWLGHWCCSHHDRLIIALNQIYITFSKVLARISFEACIDISSNSQKTRSEK